MPRQRVTLRRLFGYSTPYRGRLAWAVVGMIVYAIGSAGLAYLIRPIFDSLLPKQEYVAWTAWAIVGVYLLKGIGSYVSSYLMADVGQRVVMDLRNDLYRHILGQSAAFFAQRTTGQLMSRISNDVGQVQQAVRRQLRARGWDRPLGSNLCAIHAIAADALGRVSTFSSCRRSRGSNGAGCDWKRAIVPTST